MKNISQEEDEVKSLLWEAFGLPFVVFFGLRESAQPLIRQAGPPFHLTRCFHLIHVSYSCFQPMADGTIAENETIKQKFSGNKLVAVCYLPKPIMTKKKKEVVDVLSGCVDGACETSLEQGQSG